VREYNAAGAEDSSPILVPFVDGVRLRDAPGSGLTKRELTRRFGITDIKRPAAAHSWWGFSLAPIWPNRLAELTSFLLWHGIEDVLDAELAEDGALESRNVDADFEKLIAGLVVRGFEGVVTRYRATVYFGRRASGYCDGGPPHRRARNKLRPTEPACPHFDVAKLTRADLLAINMHHVSDLPLWPGRIHEILPRFRTWAPDPLDESTNVGRLLRGSRWRTRFEVEPPDSGGKAFVEAAVRRFTIDVPARAQAVHQALRVRGIEWPARPRLSGIRNPVDEHISAVRAAAGRRGGKARMKRLSPQQRRELATNAARARWDRFRKQRGTRAGV